MAKATAKKTATGKAANAKAEERPLSVTIRRIVRTTPMLPTAKPASVGLSSSRLQILTDEFQRQIDSRALPGAVMLIARNGKVGYLKALGKQAPESDQAMSTDSIFRIMSMTKPIVSIGLMQLVEAGKLLISDPLSKYIPEFAKMNVGIERDGKLELVPAAREITIQDLLRHTSGLTGNNIGTSMVQRLYQEADLRNRNLTNEQHAQKLASLPLAYQPGTHWNYGRSTDVLGRVIEVVSGQSLGRYLAANILAPLQMWDTGFFAASRNAARLAEPLATDPWTGDRIALFDMLEQPAMEAGGGGLVSTAVDYARFCQMLLNGGTLNGERIIGPKTLAFMASDHLGPDVRKVGDFLPPGISFGLGFAVRTTTGMAPVPGSPGQFYWSGIAGTAFWIDPVERMFAIFLSQAPGQRMRYLPMFRNMVHAAIDK